jgi:hypothetical protein
VVLSVGRYIQFLDADDVLHPRKLERQRRLLDSRADVDIVYGPVSYFDSEGPTLAAVGVPGDERDEPRELVLRDPLLRLVERNQFTVLAALMRRSLFNTAGGFDTGLSRLEDWDFWLRCALVGARFVELRSDEPLACVRLHASSMSHRRKDMLEAEVEFRETLNGVLERPEVAALNSRRRDDTRAELCVIAGLEGRTGAVGQLASLAIHRRRWKWLVWAFTLGLARFSLARTALADFHRRRRELSLTDPRRAGTPKGNTGSKVGQ